MCYNIYATYFTNSFLNIFVFLFLLNSLINNPRAKLIYIWHFLSRVLWRPVSWFQCTLNAFATFLNAIVSCIWAHFAVIDYCFFFFFCFCSFLVLFSHEWRECDSHVYRWMDKNIDFPIYPPLCINTDISVRTYYGNKSVQYFRNVINSQLLYAKVHKSRGADIITLLSWPFLRVNLFPQSRFLIMLRNTNGWHCLSDHRKKMHVLVIIKRSVIL